MDEVGRVGRVVCDVGCTVRTELGVATCGWRCLIRTCASWMRLRRCGCARTDERVGMNKDDDVHVTLAKRTKGIVGCNRLLTTPSYV